MGIYYAWVNHDKRERVSLHELTQCGDKLAVLANPKVGAAIAILFGAPISGDPAIQLKGRWIGDCVEVMHDAMSKSSLGFHWDEIEGFGTGPRYTELATILRTYEPYLHSGHGWPGVRLRMRAPAGGHG